MDAMTQWPHAPLHWFEDTGSYFITAGTYQKQLVFKTADDLTYLQETMFASGESEGVDFHGWSFFPNHYHVVVHTEENAKKLRTLIHDVHSITAKELNARYEEPGRRVWYQYRDTHLTFERSYLARLNYVHQNPVHHGLVAQASNYAWCSAGWFERTARRAFFESVRRFKIDRVKVPDDYIVEKF